ncbi:class I SAM-dependent methyltransferase [Pseudobacteriovorax antillogorgiicola]|uniref:Methyltransferase domain-containing protein n=1 Tax=Pseudobacteriovorax antillogorgiicola TaxID=1513793 RepID=A0A1Y6BJQ7_9BACT|nr:methyltransferase domain-containing protein [Pseudobacteriovorax antillogorgiicola]TCS56358.1 methyltransferase family protein [Pseudobacteriovorax antillogorgiicola]SMF06689.1 Methyltransferase domain-containing protein [Pseudobacteriovorax antillogorgiicola]
MRQLVLVLIVFGVTAGVQGHHRVFPPSSIDSRYYKVLAKHHPQSTGKWYMGRQIAEVMGPAGIPWLERPERQKEEDIRNLIKLLKLKPGMTVADVGAGSGRLSFLMAQELAPKGRVYALEIQEKMLNTIRTKAKKLKVRNVLARQSSVNSLGLKAGVLDLVLMVDVYHEFSHPHEMVLSMVKSLKKGGRIALVEYRGEDPKVPIKILHKMTMKQIKYEFSRPEFGLTFKELESRLPRQHLVFFEKS